MNGLSKNSVIRRSVAEDGEDQRIDNYLVKHLKGVPKSLIYRILRTGEVRVNSRRVGPEYRLQMGDELRLPPLRVSEAEPLPRGKGAPPDLWRHTLFEDDALVVLDKPAGVAVHGGSGISSGVVEALRRQRPQLRFLELVHRLDKETSGILLLAKKRSALTRLQQQLREGGVDKRYLALVRGRWRNRRQQVELPLYKYRTAAGERRVSVDDEGRHARTVFTLIERWPGFSLLEAELITGRTHQIRVHLAHMDFPIAGDDKYGDFAWNRELAARGLKRMFLHAARIGFIHPVSQEPVAFQAPLPRELQRFLDSLPGGEDMGRTTSG